MRTLLIVLALSLLVGCAYPRRSTSLTPAHDVDDVAGAPSHIWQLRFLSANAPPRQRSGMDWDESEGGPDCYIRFFRDEELIWESETFDDDFEPRFDALLPKNVSIPPSSALRIELWDRDDIQSDPIGIWRGHGLPSNALPGADARITMDSDVTLIFRVDSPQPHRGVGITSYEVHGDALVVLEVAAESPAGRAGVEVRDRIVAIGGQEVSDMGEARSASALSLSIEQGAALTIERNQRRHDVEMDRGYVWLTM